MRLTFLLCSLLLTVPVFADSFEKGLRSYEARFYDDAYRIWLPLARQGDSRAQTHLGLMFLNGEGVARDPEKAVALYRQSAEQGYTNAQHNLGYEYFAGEVIEKDYTKAMAWFRKAANQGLADSMNNIGWMYANGLGVERDAVQAESWYREAISHGDTSAPLNLAELLKSECSNATTRLFGILIRCSSRDSLMVAVKDAGAIVKREDKERWSDVYDSSGLLKGSSKLVVAYTLDDYFALAEYTFPSSMDTEQVHRIKEMVASKYGRPDRFYGSSHLGKAGYTWDLEDGIEIKVHRGWPDTTTYLAYTFPENYQSMQAAAERQRKAKVAQEAQAQNSAF